jgi:glycosyltransferase involved in cell wall biosynthesis
VLSVGRLSKEKAHDQLLRAFARLSRAGLATAALVIAGDGPERLTLKRLADRLGLDGRVHFEGHQGNVWPYYHSADVIALPSDSEGSPIALLEAMAAAKPIVATSVGGIPEIIEDHRTGILVPPRDPGALADALAHVLRKPLLASNLGRQAQAEVRRRFHIEARMSALFDVYRRVAHA